MPMDRETIAYWLAGEPEVEGSPLSPDTQRELYTAARFGHLGVLATAYTAEGLEYPGVCSILPGELEQDREIDLQELNLTVTGIYAYTSRHRAMEVRQSIRNALPTVNDTVDELARRHGINTLGMVAGAPDPAVYALRNTGGLYVHSSRSQVPEGLVDSIRRIRQNDAFVRQ